jgi:hypothetical protein
MYWRVFLFPQVESIQCPNLVSQLDGFDALSFTPSPESPRHLRISHRRAQRLARMLRVD